MSRPRGLRVTLLALLVVAGAATLGLAQSDSHSQSLSAPPAILSGRVYLQSRSNHVGANVQVGELSTTTDSDGRFALPNTPTGSRTVRASAPGFLDAELTVNVSPGQLSTLPAATLLAGDVNEDGTIDLLDLVAVGSVYRQCPPAIPLADITGDGCVDLWDLVLVGMNYGKTAPMPWGGSAAADPPSPTSTFAATPSATPTLPAMAEALCMRIVDGDTIIVESSSVLYRVRYIGIDTPEKGECYYGEATERNRAFVEHKVVRLVKDTSETDIYRRALRYVYVNDLFVNAALVRQGYARTAVYRPDTLHADDLALLEQEAASADRGIWGTCATATPTATPSVTAACLRAEEAWDHLDERACVEFRVVDANRGDVGLYLNSNDPWKGHFYVLVWNDLCSRCWGGCSEARFESKDVRVSGTIREYKGSPEIVLQDCAEIVLLN